MYIIYNRDGSIKKVNLCEYINQGSDGVNKIYVSVIGVDPTNYTVSVRWTLPSGENVGPVVCEWNATESAYEVVLGENVTLYEGILKGSIVVTDLLSNRLYTYPAKLVVNPSTYEPSGDVNITQVEYDNLLNYIKSFDDNLRKGEGTNSFEQIVDTEEVNFTGRNAHAEAIDPTLSTTIPTGASGDESTSLNGNTMALAKRSLANGNKTVTKGQESHAEGYQSVTLGDGSHAEGSQTVAAGTQSHSEGALTQALGDNSHAEGHDTIAGANASHSEGAGTKIGDYAQATGIGADHSTPGSDPTPTPPVDPYVAEYGEGSHAEGYYNVVKGWGSHAEGLRNYLDGNYSHIDGANNTNSGDYSYVAGYNNIATKDCSFTFGVWNENNGYSSFVSGFHNKTAHDYRAVFGKYNYDNPNAIFVVGNGTDNTHRSNAFEVYEDGTVKVNGASLSVEWHEIPLSHITDYQASTIVGSLQEITIIVGNTDIPADTKEIVIDAMPNVAVVPASWFIPNPYGRITITTTAGITQTDIAHIYYR